MPSTSPAPPLSRAQLLAILDVVQACAMYEGVDIVSFAHAYEWSDTNLAFYVSRHVEPLPHHDRLRVYGAMREYERQVAEVAA